MPRQWTHVETAQLDIHSLKVALCFVMNKVELSSWKSYRSQQLIALGGGAACAGRVSGPQQIHFLGSSVHLANPMYPAFPDWIPATRTIRAQDQPKMCLCLLSNSGLLSRVKLLFI